MSEELTTPTASGRFNIDIEATARRLREQGEQDRALLAEPPAPAVDASQADREIAACLDMCPHTIRCCEGGGLENIYGSLALTFSKMMSIIAAQTAELGSNTDLPSPTGSVYALKNWWKQQCDVAVEQAAALRGALEISHACGAPEHIDDDSDSGAWEWTHPDGRTWSAPAEWNTPPPMHPLATAALTGSAGAGWLPIESAPRDGTKIDLWGRDIEESFHSKPARRYCECWFIPASPSWEAHHWWSPNNGGIRATHWRPLPPPPAEPAAEGGGL